MQNLTPHWPAKDALWQTEFGAITLERLAEMRELQRIHLRREAAELTMAKSTVQLEWSTEMEIRNERCIDENGFSIGLW